MALPLAALPLVALPWQQVPLDVSEGARLAARGQILDPSRQMGNEKASQQEGEEEGAGEGQAGGGGEGLEPTGPSSEAGVWVAAAAQKVSSAMAEQSLAEEVAFQGDVEEG